MSSVNCPRHGSEVLLSESRILGIDPTGDGLMVRWVCWWPRRLPPPAVLAARSRSSDALSSNRRQTFRRRCLSTEGMG